VWLARTLAAIGLNCKGGGWLPSCLGRDVGGSVLGSMYERSEGRAWAVCVLYSVFGRMRAEREGEGTRAGGPPQVGLMRHKWRGMRAILIEQEE
jgi:hypothetical protein